MSKQPKKRYWVEKVKFSSWGEWCVISQNDYWGIFKYEKDAILFAKLKNGEKHNA